MLKKLLLALFGIIFFINVSHSSEPIPPTFFREPMVLGAGEHLLSLATGFAVTTLFQYVAFATFKKIGWVKRERRVDWTSLFVLRLLNAVKNYYNNFVLEPQNSLTWAQKAGLSWAYGTYPPAPEVELAVRGATFLWMVADALIDLYLFSRKHPRCFYPHHPLETLRHVPAELIIYEPIPEFCSAVHEIGHYTAARLFAPEMRPRIVSNHLTLFEEGAEKRWQAVLVSAAGGVTGGLFALINIGTCYWLSKTVCKKPNANEQSFASVIRSLAHYVTKKALYSWVMAFACQGDNLFLPLGEKVANQEDAYFERDCGQIYQALKIKPSLFFGF